MGRDREKLAVDQGGKAMSQRRKEVRGEVAPLPLAQPKKRPWLLALSVVLLLAWLGFLAWMALVAHFTGQ